MGSRPFRDLANEAKKDWTERDHVLYVRAAAVMRRRQRKPRRLTYLYVFPADRLGGWLCDGNDTRGMAMLEKRKN